MMMKMREAVKIFTPVANPRTLALFLCRGMAVQGPPGEQHALAMSILQKASENSAPMPSDFNDDGNEGSGDEGKLFTGTGNTKEASIYLPF